MNGRGDSNYHLPKKREKEKINQVILKYTTYTDFITPVYKLKNNFRQKQKIEFDASVDAESENDISLSSSCITFLLFDVEEITGKI